MLENAQTKITSNLTRNFLLRYSNLAKNNINLRTKTFSTRKSKDRTHVTLSSAAAFKLCFCGMLLRSKTTKARLKSCPVERSGTMLQRLVTWYFYLRGNLNGTVKTFDSKFQAFRSQKRTKPISRTLHKTRIKRKQHQKENWNHPNLQFRRQIHLRFNKLPKAPEIHKRNSHQTHWNSLHTFLIFKINLPNLTMQKLRVCYKGSRSNFTTKKAFRF